jgi:uncharacterized protein with PQ loop repeat
MNSADIALAVFTACNSVRVFAYLPQLMKIGRDTEGAMAISYSTWGMFSLSHMSTVAYAIVVVQDWKMACVFAANTLCCSAIPCPYRVQAQRCQAPPWLFRRRESILMVAARGPAECSARDLESCRNIGDDSCSSLRADHLGHLVSDLSPDGLPMNGTASTLFGRRSNSAAKVQSLVRWGGMRCANSNWVLLP